MPPTPSRLFALILASCLASSCASESVLDGACTSSPTRQYSGDWHRLSDTQLRVEIGRACGHVFVGFKEAGAVRGVDPQGANLTSSETVSQMTRYLVDRGVTLEWQSANLPHVSGRMAPRLDLVRELRRHRNIDYLEPIFPGSFDVR